LLLYDFLSHFQNRPHEMLSPKETLKKLPSLDERGLKGAGKYFDGIVDDAKLSLECLYDALLEPQASALSYHCVTEVTQLAQGHQIKIQNQFNSSTETVQAEFVVFTTGPFTDKLLPTLNIPWAPQLVPSKGIHLWLESGSIKVDGSVVLTTKDNRVVFVIPQRDAILVGTTETPLTEDIFNIQATSTEVDYLLGVLNQYFPHAQISSKSIISTFAAVRPLARQEGIYPGLGKVSRHHKIYRPTSRSYVMIGGKYTTFRKMAQDLAKEIVPRLGKIYQPHLTLNPLRQKSLMPTFGEKPTLTIDLVKQIIQKEYVTTLEDLIKRRLSLFEEMDHLNEVMGIPIEKIRALF
jgi:glycerol-3-phosphate dehydrogenase